MPPPQPPPAIASYAQASTLTKIPNTDFHPLAYKVTSNKADLKTQSTDVNGNNSTTHTPLNNGTLFNPLMLNQGCTPTNDTIESIPIKSIEIIDDVPCVKWIEVEVAYMNIKEKL